MKCLTGYQSDTGVLNFSQLSIKHGMTGTSIPKKQAQNKKITLETQGKHHLPHYI